MNDIFKDVFDDVSLILNESTSSKDIEEWDSLNHVILLLAIENEFKIKFALGEIGALKNVKDLIDLTKEKVSDTRVFSK